jgi:hypothetical protein
MEFCEVRTRLIPRNIFIYQCGLSVVDVVATGITLRCLYLLQLEWKLCRIFTNEPKFCPPILAKWTEITTGLNVPRLLYRLVVTYHVFLFFIGGVECGGSRGWIPTIRSGTRRRRWSWWRTFRWRVLCLKNNWRCSTHDVILRVYCKFLLKSYQELGRTEYLQTSVSSKTIATSRPCQWCKSSTQNSFHFLARASCSKAG